MDLTSDDVQDILQLLDSLPFGELHLQTHAFRLSLYRTADGEWTQQMEVLTPPRLLPGPAADPAPGAPARTVPVAQAVPPVPAEPGASGRGPGHGLTDVRAPLLGTFYRAPRPGEDPFVTVGSHVEADTVIGIIETMKLMNSVCAGVRGTVAEIPVGNAQFVAQDTPLVRIREEG